MREPADAARDARAGRLILEGSLVALASLLCAAWVLRLWHADLAVPLRYSPVDDTKFYLMLVKGIVEHGSYLSNGTLGAPFGQHLADYPQGGDDLNLIAIRVLALFSSNPAVVINLFFLLTFAAAAFCAHIVLRLLGLAAGAAGVVSVLFSLLSYHFFRGESHLLLSAYYGVPLSLYLLLGVLVDAHRPGADSSAGARRRRSWSSPRSMALLAICVIVGSDSLYYATFTVVMLAAGSLVALLTRDRAAAIRGAALVSLIVAVVAANLAPTLIYRAQHGPNRALERSAAFTEKSDEAFSLRLANLVLPAPDSHIAPLSRLAGKYDNTIAPGYCEACYGSLGTVGTIGFIWLILGALAALAGAGGYLATQRLRRGASVGILIALGLGTIGGVASLIEVFVTPDIRAWNRISVFIAFLSLLGVALLLEKAGMRLRRRRHGGLLASLLLAGVLVFGVYDQSSDSYIPPYGATARQWHDDGGFVRRIEQVMPAGAAVFQLPYVPFPEGYPETPVGDAIATYATKYEQLRGYLHSTRLRWSYGAMKGRPEDWESALSGQPLPYVLAAAASAGFDGLWLDTTGFEPAKATAIREQLGSLLGQAPIADATGELLFYDLRPFLAHLRSTHSAAQLESLSEQTLHPLRTTCERGALEIENPSPQPRTATLSAHLARGGSSEDESLAPPPDGQASDIASASTVIVERRLLLKPGETHVSLASASRALGGTLQVLYATVTDIDLTSFQTGTSNAAVPGLTGPPCDL